MNLSRPFRALLGRLPLPWQLRVTVSTGLVLNNLLGSAVLLVLTPLLIPIGDVERDADVRRRITEMALAAVVVGTAVTMIASRNLMTRLLVWLEEDRIPSNTERLAVLRAPARLSGVNAALWATGAVIFGMVGWRMGSLEYGVIIAVTVSLSGLSVTSTGFLVAERALRPMARKALATGVPERLIVPSVAARSMGFWALGSGVAALGVGVAGAVALRVPKGEVTVKELAVTMIVLGGVAFLAGGWNNWLASRASSDPVRSLRLAVARVSDGDLDAHVDVYDGTEIGILQAGFNEMVHGLRERETIRDLFGRHVGSDVAKAALEGGVQLGGEIRDIAVLFVDIIGSTTLATERPPDEVVRLLNRFFDVVIDTVHEYDGWINKFEGDAALAIWGAPIAVENRDQRILTAARVMGHRLATEVPELAAGIGVSAGPAVAGNVGAAERYEYTVIGDPVNEAARLTGQAKAVPTHVVANARLLANAGDEAAHWQHLEPIVVRGRAEPTPICTPTGRDQ